MAGNGPGQGSPARVLDGHGGAASCVQRQRFGLVAAIAVFRTPLVAVVNPLSRLSSRFPSSLAQCCLVTELAMRKSVAWLCWKNSWQLPGGQKTRAYRHSSMPWPKCCSSVKSANGSLEIRSTSPSAFAQKTLHPLKPRKSSLQSLQSFLPLAIPLLHPL